MAAAGFLLRRGWRVVGLEGSAARLQDPQFIAQAQRMGLEYRSDREPIDATLFDELIVSPGVSPTHPVYQQALAQNLQIVGEVELALRYLHQPMVAVTGTNGKTTVTLLVEHVLKSVGKRARALGNVGEPLCDYVDAADPEEILVVELSSYQLETMNGRVFDAAVLLNITPDHLDRYVDMKAYAEAKCRLQECLKAGAPFFVHISVVSSFGELLKPGYRTYSCLEDGENIELIWPLGYRLMGKHDRDNALAAFRLCEPWGVTAQEFCRGLETFKKPAHRLEFVSEIDGVRYVDDSKGTNIDAVVQAVGAMSGPVVLIAGGVDKGASYLPWKEAFGARVKQMVVIGDAAEKIEGELRHHFVIARADSLASAVEKAAKIAERGDTVLLSPGCSSYDMFRDYAHRGEVFQQSVKNLESLSERR